MKDFLLTWIIISFCYLVLLFIEDHITKKGFVDDRKNYFMMGFTLMFAITLEHNIYYILCVILLVLAIRFFWGRINMLGEGDLNSLVWLLYGFFMIDYRILLFFMLCFMSIGIIYVSMMRFFKINKAPYFAVILVCYVLSILVLYYIL